MSLMPIPTKTVTALRRTQNPRVKRTDYADLPNAAVYWPSTKGLAWEATVDYDLNVTVRRVHLDRVDSLDADIVHADDVFTGVADSNQPEALARAINRVRREKSRGVAA